MTHADRDRSEPVWPPHARNAYQQPTTGLPEHLEAIRAGADATPTPENAWPTAGQLWHQLLEAPVDERLDELGRLITAASSAHLARMHAERALADHRAKVAAGLAALDLVIESIERDDSGEPVCHDYDRTDTGECALLADLRQVRAALAGDA